MPNRYLYNLLRFSLCNMYLHYMLSPYTSCLQCLHSSLVLPMNMHHLHYRMLHHSCSYLCQMSSYPHHTPYIYFRQLRCMNQLHMHMPPTFHYTYHCFTLAQCHPDNMTPPDTFQLLYSTLALCFHCHQTVGYNNCCCNVR